MGRAPCCDKTKVKRGPWSPEENATLIRYLETQGTSVTTWSPRHKWRRSPLPLKKKKKKKKQSLVLELGSLKPNPSSF
ncbi:hypothetical protein ACOSQ4_016177 [Xanthoceras sorbifolium]